MSGGDRARELPPEGARLVATLRELRATTGLSLAALAARTPYSKSSWERYLNGRTLPPRQAVEALCELAGTEPRRPLALWELAEAAWSGRAGRGEPGTAKEEPARRAPSAAAPLTPAPRRPRLLVGALATLALLAAGSLFALSRDGDGGDATADRTATADFAAPRPGCHAASCTGKDPEDLECSTARTPPVSLGEQRFEDTTVKVRLSDVCGTVWGRIDRGVVGDRVEIVVPGVEAQQARVKDEFDEAASLSTPMAPATEDVLDRVRACLLRDGERRCFTATP
jgi:transcriptional regulator with XRE-family HTH domain